MILDEIVARKQEDLPRDIPMTGLEPSRRSLKSHLKGRHHLIAEIKRRSPSAGHIRAVNAGEAARIYDQYASAISVLTDRPFFGGEPADIRRVKDATRLPVLRKDFIIDEMQIRESRQLGADAILLIAAILSGHQLAEYLEAAGELGMDCLVEVHTEAELESVLETRAEIIGINNRDLHSMTIDLETTRRLRPMIPSDRMVVAESGYFNLPDIMAEDVNAVLVGTALMRATDIAGKLASLSRTRVKICGITNQEDARHAVRSGADYLGFNFFSGSPRYIAPEDAAEIIKGLPNTVSSVGVFVNDSIEDVQWKAEVAGVDMLQFHGDESAEYCLRFQRPVIKAFPVKSAMPAYETYPVFAYLFDAYDPGLHGGTGRRFDEKLLRGVSRKVFLAGGLDPDNIVRVGLKPFAMDVCSGVEREKGRKDPERVHLFVRRTKDRTRQGEFGGQFVPETLMPALEELEKSWLVACFDPDFQGELTRLLTHYAGRPTPLYHAPNFSREVGCTVYLKREDLLHGGAHKTNNVLGQALLAKRMNKTRIVAETGAGQHGVAVAMAAALVGLPSEVYMGVEDMKRQRLNVRRMRLCGARVHPVQSAPGKGTLMDAVSQALRDWTTNVRDTYYLLGSVTGPHPYPGLVRSFQEVIGVEARRQILEQQGRLPDHVLACVGGGSNAIGVFSGFLEDEEVRLTGVEAGGDGHRHGATLSRGLVGVFQGARTMVLQDDDGQILEAESVAAGLDYPGVGPQHAHLQQIGRVEYGSVSDAEAVRAFRLLSRTEGIIPALESAHALAYALRMQVAGPEVILINLSGRGDKDLHSVGEEESDGSAD